VNGTCAVVHTEHLLELVSQGDERALEQLLSEHRPYLHRLIELRLDNDMHARIDPSDVVQETQIVAVRRIDEFLKNRPTSFRTWLRSKALERLVEAHRHHHAQKRSVDREVSLSGISSFAIARHVCRSLPSSVIQQRELAQAAQQALVTLNELDREVLLLRHGEGLTNAEVAEVLRIEPDTASKRYGRAVRRLCERLREMGIRREA
jgi:RNA polymerase sigma-70 factor, ECF subfamily